MSLPQKFYLSISQPEDDNTLASKKIYVRGELILFCFNTLKLKYSETGVFKKRCSENIQQIYRRTPTQENTQISPVFLFYHELIKKIN